MHIRIAVRSRRTVVTLVMAPATPVRQPRIKSQSRGRQTVVPMAGSRHQKAMHAVMADDEQTGLQQGAQSGCQQYGWPGLIPEIQGQQGDQQKQPGQRDGRGPEKTPAGYRDQRANLSRSAGEASRSMATK